MLEPRNCAAKPEVVEEASYSNDRGEFFVTIEQDLDLISGALHCVMFPIAVWRTAPQTYTKSGVYSWAALVASGQRDASLMKTLTSG